MNKMLMDKTYHVCRTGKLQQFYTLYITTNISYTESDFTNSTCTFMQNLGHSKNTAISKVVDMIKQYQNRENITVDMDFNEVPKREYCNITAFGFEWKKTKNGLITVLSKYSMPEAHYEQKYIDKINTHNKRISDFWQLWKEKKSILKDSGFSVFKSDDGQFRLFFRNCSDEEMFEKMSILNAKFDESGEYIGEIKERIKDIYVKCVQVNSFKSMYGINQVCIFEDSNGRKIKTKYSGTKYTIKEGQEYKLTGSIVRHEILDLIKTTYINRIILK